MAPELNIRKLVQLFKDEDSEGIKSLILVPEDEKLQTMIMMQKLLKQMIKNEKGLPNHSNENRNQDKVM
jgi:hypothetical protein